ncbi:hypothetical protein OJAV_G00144790 [Oryzias javanicus]|uniref:Uncharacterized protein n=1 Tax=Oryzias javanicus TaxID=123683 RepID=A0A437CQJ7_ORYJA|nr:hypothetical protein OJAV_G00144790 [Oryzias javanicus]
MQYSRYQPPPAAAPPQKPKCHRISGNFSAATPARVGGAERTEPAADGTTDASRTGSALRRSNRKQIDILISAASPTFCVRSGNAGRDCLDPNRPRDAAEEASEPDPRRPHATPRPPGDRPRGSSGTSRCAFSHHTESRSSAETFVLRTQTSRCDFLQISRELTRHARLCTWNSCVRARLC